MITNTLIVLILTLGAAAYMKLFLELKELKSQIQQCREAVVNKLLRLDSNINHSVITKLADGNKISINEFNKLIATLLKSGN
ncbi:MAG: hypothetical protein RR128_08460, partial [Clostridium sp.]